jgi:hypothetical protein
MSAPDTTNDTYLLEVDGNTCYNVGGNNVPTYASGATTYFANNSTNWINKTSSNTVISQSLSAGTHTLKLIGNAPGVVVDRIVFTQDTACTPSGDGSNCSSSPDTTSPVVSITSPANNAALASTTTVTANATDNVSVSKVEFYVDSALKSTDSTADGSNNFTYSLDPSSLADGNHTLTAKAYDAANNSTTSNSVTITTGAQGTKVGDINLDGVVNFLDLSILASKYGQSGSGIGRSDLNSDNIVNFLDLSVLASHYGT